MKYKIRKLRTITVVAAVLISAVCIIQATKSDEAKPSENAAYSAAVTSASSEASTSATLCPTETVNTTAAALAEPPETDVEILLVNADNPLPENYFTELTMLSNGRSVSSEIYSDLQLMFDDMRSQYIYPAVSEGYRTNEQQQELLDNKVVSFLNQGYSSENAEAEALKWVAIPGTSEHEAGLAVDINADPGLSANETVYQWLRENAHSYGFILRYPAEKTHITGISYEPWHYRWVGKEIAPEIYESGLCLEEYIESIS